MNTTDLVQEQSTLVYWCDGDVSLCTPDGRYDISGDNDNGWLVQDHNNGCFVGGSRDKKEAIELACTAAGVSLS